MIKYLLVLLLVISPVFTKMIGAIAMTVNGEPITLYEINAMSSLNHISKEDAVNALIQQKIEDEEIQKNGIYVTPEEIDQKLQQIAQQNKLTMPQFQKAVEKEGKSLANLRKGIGRQIKKEKLYQKILGGKLKKPDESALKQFYTKHKKEFTIPGKIKIQEYASNNPKALQAIRMQPMLMLPQVKITPRILDPKTTNPQLLQLLLQTPTKQFTPIINIGKSVAMFFVESKGKPVTAPFEAVKKNIFLKLMKDQEQANLIAYFEKKKSEADIQVKRKP